VKKGAVESAETLLRRRWRALIESQLASIARMQ
jgi:hypothetical protein